LWEFNDSINSRKSLLSVIIVCAGTGQNLQEYVQALRGRQAPVILTRGTISLLVSGEDLDHALHSMSLAESLPTL
jgi:hypothetical protein